MTSETLEFESYATATYTEAAEFALRQRAQCQAALSGDWESLGTALAQGALDVWLDRRLPLLLLANPTPTSNHSMGSGAFFAGLKVARGLHLVDRQLLSSEDDYHCLKLWLQRWWEGHLSLAQVRRAIWPWDSGFAVHDSNRGFTILDQALVRSDRFAEQICVLADLTLKALEPLADHKEDDSHDKSIYEEAQELLKLKAWAQDPDRNLMEYGRLVTSGAPLFHEVGWAYSAWAPTLLSILHGKLGVEGGPYLGAIRDEMKAPYPKCPLLRYLPSEDRVPHEAYFEMEPVRAW